MLPDSAHIQQKDVEFVNKHPRRRGPRHREPLYTPEDTEAILERFESHPYGARFSVCEGIEATFQDAGHILGSAIVILDLEEKGQRRRLVFSGDLGRPQTPILRDPAPAPECDALLIESTYGNRFHPPREALAEMLAQTIDRVRARRGKILVPAFAVGRAQEIVWNLRRLVDAGRIEPLPIYVDSPLAVNATEIFARHPECYDEQMQASLRDGGDPLGFSLVRYIRDVQESIALNGKAETSIIVSASGMCEAGRILHHLRNNIEDPRNVVLIVGFQAEDTLGRRLVEKAERVRIFGEEFQRRAEVVVMNGFSAHADQTELLDWAAGSSARPRHTFVVHGSPDQSDAFASALRERRFPNVESPAVGQDLAL
jgi:metallo-beta-lactamase family protein